MIDLYCKIALILLFLIIKLYRKPQQSAITENRDDYRELIASIREQAS